MTWTAAALPPAPFEPDAAARLGDGRVLMTDFANTGTVLYEPRTNTWTVTPPMRWLHRYPTMTRLDEGRALVISNLNNETGTLELFDLNPTQSPSGWTKSAGAPLQERGWIPFPSMHMPHMEHTMTLLPDGRVLVVGATPATGMNLAEIYDPTANAWMRPLPMRATPPGRGVPMATLLPGTGKVLITGGTYPSGTHEQTEIYDAEGNSFVLTAPMLDRRNCHTATLLPGGGVFVAGGYGEGFHETTEIYEAAMNQWTSRAPMHVPRLKHTATLLSNGTVLVAGGSNRALVFDTAERYVPDSDLWIATQPMRDRRKAHTATLLPNGTVLFAGGDAGGGIPARAEIYDPARDAFHDAAPMRTARYTHTATLLPNGTVLVAGGARGINACLASVEIYDPKADTWTEGPPLNETRCSPAALLLPDGYLLMTGGSNESGVLSSTERYKVE